MLKNVFGIIYTGEENMNLIELTARRAVGALPVAGRYRVIDFMLSNMVNSGIRNVGVIAQKNYNSLMDHLGSGKEWDLSRKNDGLFILPPFDSSYNRGYARGVCDAVRNAMQYIRRASQQYCILSGCYTIFNANLEEFVKQHIDKNADITMLYNEQAKLLDDEIRFQDTRIFINEKGRVIDMEMNSAMPTSSLIGMDTYIIRKDLLEYLVEDASSRNKYNWVQDVLIPNVNRLNIYAVKPDCYVGRMHSVNAYFKINKDIIKPEVRADLFQKDRPIFTKIKDEAPTKFSETANVSNSIIANGCKIEGTVENSVLFRNVHVGAGTVIRDSIIMQDTNVYSGCTLENVILDKSVQIRSGKTLIGDKAYPVIIKKGALI